MKILRRKAKHRRPGSAGMEMTGALIVASQVAYLSPPGFDEWVRLQMVGDAEAVRREAARSTELR